MDWYINCLYAQMLYEDYGYALGLYRGADMPGNIRLHGNYYVNFETKKLIVHEDFLRTNLTQLSIQDVFNMSLLFSEEARAEYVKAVKDSQDAKILY